MAVTTVIWPQLWRNYHGKNLTVTSHLIINFGHLITAIISFKKQALGSKKLGFYYYLLFLFIIVAIIHIV